MNVFIVSTRILTLACVLLILGCATQRSELKPNPSPACDGNSFRLIVIRPSTSYGTAVRLKIQIDERDLAKLENGSYVELVLPVGTYELASRPGAILGRDFPPAKRSISGKQGEAYCYSYNMFFGPKILAYPVAPGMDVKHVSPSPEKAEWAEVDPHEIEKVISQLKRVDVRQ